MLAQQQKKHDKMQSQNGMRIPTYVALAASQKKENVVPNCFISALDQIGMDVKKPIGRFFIYFLPVMVYAFNQNSRLQLNVHVF